MTDCVDGLNIATISTDFQPGHELRLDIGMEDNLEFKELYTEDVFVQPYLYTELDHSTQ